MRSLLPHLVTLMIRFLQATCRVRVVDDPRPALRAAGQPYIYAAIHSQKVALICLSEPGCGTLVSKSKDGDLITQALERSNVRPIRGSGGSQHKGGATALRAIVEHVNQGFCAALTVDGPTGPRGIVNPGIGLLAAKTGAPALPLMLVPKRRSIIKRSWDRTQFPWPFQTIEVTFGEPLYLQPGEPPREFALRLQNALLELEQQCDPSEAEFSAPSSSNPSEGLDDPACKAA